MRLYEGALEGELTAHLGYEKQALEGSKRCNALERQEHDADQTERGELELEIPRNRESSFDPVLVTKGRRRLPGFNEKVIDLYGRGMTTREIQGHPKERYEVELISSVRDAVLDEVKAWQARPLDTVSPVIYENAST